MSAGMNIALLLGNIMPEEMLLEQMEEALTNHKLIKSEDSKGRLRVVCMLFLAKEAGEKEGIDAVMKRSDQIDKIYERMNGEKL